MTFRVNKKSFESTRYLSYLFSYIFFASIILASIGYGLWASYQTAIRNAEFNTHNLALSLKSRFEQVIDRTFALLEVQALDFPLDSLQSSAVASHQSMMTERMARLINMFSDISSTYYFDSFGDMLYSSDLNAKSTNVADRPFFKNLRDNPDLKFTFSDALIARTTGSWSIVIAHDIRDKNGHFLGVTTALLDLSQEESLLKSIQLGSLGSLSIRRSDNTNLLVQVPFVAEQMNQPLPANHPILALLQTGQELGTVFVPSPIDQIPRIVSISKLTHYPFFIQVGMAEQDYLRDWNKHAYMMSAIAGLFLLTTLLATVLHIRAESREAQAVDQIRKNEARYNALFLDSKAPMLLTDPSNGQIIEANHAAYAFYGYASGRLETMTVYDLAVISAAEIATEVTKALAEKRSYCIFRHGLANGEIRDVEAYAGPIEVEHQSLLYWIIHDITDRRHAEQIIATQNLRYQTLLKASMDGIYIIDLEGNIVDANEAFCRQLGYTLDEGLRLNIKQWNSQWSDDELLQTLRQLIASDQVHQFETQHRRKDGTLLAVEVNTVRIILEERPLLYASARDISERKKLDATILANEQKLRGMYELSPLGFAMVDMQGRFIDFNEAFRKITGYSTEEIYQLDYWDLTPKQYEPMEAVQLKSLAESGHYGPYEKEYIQKDGTLTPVQLNGMLVQGPDQKDYIWSIVENIAERKASENAMLAAKYQAESLARSKSEFLANMSHEIRTPMNAIVGMTHLLKSDNPTQIQRERLEKINSASAHLLSIINDILDLSKIEAGHVELERINFPLADIMDQVYSMLITQANDKNLVIHVDKDAVPKWILGDPMRLRQALLNYAGNALKFTTKGSITLRCLLLHEDDTGLMVRFEVQDTGPGIPADIRAKIFEKFEQADTSITRRHGGTGLGLAITRQIAKLMGGTVGVESELGHGSTFWFTAKLERGHETSSLNASSIQTDAQSELLKKYAGSRVLLVEDDVFNQEIAQLLLKDAGLSVDIAENGLQAVEKIQASTYDVVLMDMQMPELDGLGATRRIRNMQNLASIPIIAMTANAFDDDRRACIDAGMNDFVSKPVVPELLYATLLKWLTREGEKSMFTA